MINVSIKTRWHWLDWIRVMAINMVILYHTIEGVLNYRKKGPIDHELNTIKTYMQSVGLPLFFMISGMVKGLKKRQYNIKLSRISYLIIPLLISTLLFFIPAMYLKQRVLHLKNGILFKLHGDCSISEHKKMISFIQFLFFDFWKKCFIHVGFGWLWFLPFLTMLEIMSYPFIKLIDILMHTANNYNKNKEYKKYIMLLFMIGCICLIYYGAMRWIKQFYLIVIIILSHCVLFTAIKIYYISHSALTKFISLTLFIFAIIPIAMTVACFLLNIRHFANEGEELSAFDAAIDYDITYLYYWMFHLFGIVFSKIVYVEFVRKKTNKLNEYLNWFKIICNHCAILLIFSAISIRTEKHDRAYTFVNIFQEPDCYQRSMFIIACWIFLYAICMSAKYTMDTQFSDVKNKQMAKIIYKSSLIVYCCHGLFVECLTFWWYDGVKNYQQFTTRSHIWAIYITTVFLSYLFAFLLLRLKQIAKFFDIEPIPKVQNSINN